MSIEKNMDELKRQKTRNMAMRALAEIRGKYNMISAYDIDKFMPIYYPIAMVEMELDEVTYEDFETVQLAVMNLCGIGISDSNTISRTLGLTPVYVDRLLHVLQGCGLLDEYFRITEQGKSSLSAETKIVQNKVRQLFQVDAMNGTLLKLSDSISDTMMNERDETAFSIGHLEFMEGTSLDSIVEQMSRNTALSYIQHPDGILDTNVKNVQIVECRGIEYAKCYLMKFRGLEDPVIFAKVHNNSKRTRRDSWKPLSLPSRFPRQRYGFEEEIPDSTVTCLTFVNNVVELIDEKVSYIHINRSEQEEERIRNKVLRVYPFQLEGVKFIQENGLSTSSIIVSDAAFRKYTRWVFDFLLSIGSDGQYLLADDYMNGKILVIRTDSGKIREIAGLVVEAVQKHGKGQVFRLINDKLSGDAEGDIFNQIRNSLVEILGISNDKHIPDVTLENVVQKVDELDGSEDKRDPEQSIDNSRTNMEVDRDSVELLSDQNAGVSVTHPVGSMEPLIEGASDGEEYLTDHLHTPQQADSDSEMSMSAPESLFSIDVDTEIAESYPVNAKVPSGKNKNVKEEYDFIIVEE